MKALQEIRARVPDTADMSRAEKDRARLLAGIDAVLNLHAPRTDGSDEPYCRHCMQEPYGHAPYPCPTVEALEAGVESVA